jgi:hypothetical protein
MKNLIDLIRNRTRDLPDRSAVAQPSTSPRTAEMSEVQDEHGRENTSTSFNTAEKGGLRSHEVLTISLGCARHHSAAFGRYSSCHISLTSALPVIMPDCQYSWMNEFRSAGGMV